LTSTITGIFYLLIILSILVIAHEYGHFLFARLFKTRVDEFSLFFGKVLWRVGKRGDTVYNVRALPLGGFVKIAGMEGDDISGGRPILEAVRDPKFVDGDALEDLVKRLNEDADADISSQRISRDVAELISTSVGPDGLLLAERRADLEAKQLSPNISDDEKKLIQMVLVADDKASDTTLYNSKPIYQRALIIFGGPLFSLLFGYLVFIGVFMAVGVERVSNRVLHVKDDGAAKAAGIKEGDRILGINGQMTRSGDKLREITWASAGKRLMFTVQRGGQRLEIAATPESKKVPDEVEGEKKVGLIGVEFDTDHFKLGPLAAVVEGTRFTNSYMSKLLRAVFSRHISRNVGGPVAMAQISIKVQEFGLIGLVQMAAMFSISLGIMNLLPIPILDGGHLLLLAIEKIRRRRLTPREVYRAQLVGVAMLAVIVCLVMYNDIARLITRRPF
jgi:regulator of sigma E protease